ncbi:MAG: protein kinase domain-containing protein [Gemmataceae bacterium]
MSRADCPSLDVLNRYAGGDLAEGIADTLDGHLATCPDCLGRLDQILAAGTDPLVAALRRPAPAGAENAHLDRAVAGVLAAPPDAGPGPGAVLGGYRLLEEVGRGGMGRVYRARHPRLEQDVALKVLRPGIDSAPTLARFEAERQALALMDHPNIARVLDGGVTDDGRPFFVMELVHGSAVSRYCEERRLDLRGRLSLFADICQAVQHAHQKGVIHRDLKPSNVLVAEYDGRPVPKVIDFGVAKALERRSAARTEAGMLIGTPQYMSPEQADLASDDIDTRSDIYALGVLLYELLTGDTPVPRARLNDLPVLEVLRQVREDDPPCPSARLSGAEWPAEAGTRPGSAREVHGDLDWIVMKALAKERDRRYESAAALAEDVRRHLHDEPVAAGPPSRTYRLRKFLRRNGRAVLAAGLILASLLAGTVGTAIALVRALRAEDLAGQRLAKVTEEASKAEAERDATDRVVQWVGQDLLGQTSSLAQSAFRHPLDPDIKLRTALDRAVSLTEDQFAARPRVEVKLRHLIGRTYNELGDGATARAHLDRAAELAGRLYDPDAPESLQILLERANAYTNKREYHLAEPLLADLVTRTARALPAGDRFALRARARWAELLDHRERKDSAEAVLTLLLDDCRRELGEDDLLTLGVESMLGSVLTSRQEFARAAGLLKHAHEGILRVLGPDCPQPWIALRELANHYRAQRQWDEAEPMLVRILGEHRRLLGPGHPVTCRTLTNLGALYSERRDLERARPLLTEALERRRRLGADHMATIDALVLLGELHLRQHRPADGEPLLAEALELSRKHDATSRTRLRAVNALANLHLGRSQWDRAEPFCREVLEIVRGRQTPLAGDFFTAYSNLSYCLLEQGKTDAAEGLLREYLGAAERHKQEPGRTGYMRALLGHALARQERYAEAEPLFLGGYAEMESQRGKAVTVITLQISETVRRLVRLYEDWGRPDDAAKWRAKLPPVKRPKK